MERDSGTRPFGTIVVIGGGCYGSQYVRQLRRARAAGRVTFERVVAVDRDPDCALTRARASDPDGASDLTGHADGWAAVEVVAEKWTPFLSRWLDAAVEAPGDHVRDAIVPSPLMPHLLFEWLIERAHRLAGPAAIRVETPHEIVGVPWQKVGADGTRYVSFATWTCPINCIEPATCPHTRTERDWSLHRTLPLAGEPAGEPTVVLGVTHRAFGVGMVDVADVVAAHDAVVRAVRAGGTLRIATASHCHGAVASLRQG